MIKKGRIVINILLGLIFTICLCIIFFNFFKKEVIYSNRSIGSFTLGKVTKSTAHIFIVVEENHNWQDLKENTDAPFMNNLLSLGAYASNYHNVLQNSDELHPSQPNYISLIAGTNAFADHTFTVDDDPSSDNSTSSRENIISLLEKNGYTWKAYQEDISGNNCPIYAENNYATKHNPFVYFQQVSGNPPSLDNTYCKGHIRPLTELQTDLQNNTVANYTFITPNLDNDMHDGSVAQADTWLSNIVLQITSSNTFKTQGILFITWDEGSEDTNGNNPIGLIMQSPFVKKGYTNDTYYSHASLLKTTEEIFHLSPFLGTSADPSVKDLSDFFISFP